MGVIKQGGGSGAQRIWSPGDNWAFRAKLLGVESRRGFRAATEECQSLTLRVSLLSTNLAIIKELVFRK